MIDTTKRVGLTSHNFVFAFCGPIRELSNRPDDQRVMLELAALFMSNWGLDALAEKGSGDSKSGVVFNDNGGTFHDQDGNITQGFREHSVNNVIDAHHEWEIKKRRAWGEEAVFWIDRAVRKETQYTVLWKLRKRVSNRGLRPDPGHHWCRLVGFVCGEVLVPPGDVLIHLPVFCSSYSNLEYTSA